MEVGLMNAFGKPLSAAPPLEAESTPKESQPADFDAACCAPTVRGPMRPAGRRMLPCRFGEYGLVEEIARGGMGIVYKARQHIGRGERFVALKMIQAGRFASREAVERFRQEARAAATLDHSGIVAIYDVGEIDEQLYFTMPLLTGGSLEERMHEGPLPPRLAADVVRQVAQAVQHAHERGIIHRDLKPANVLLAHGTAEPHVAAGYMTPSDSGPWGSDATLVVRVTDFGIARTRESELSVTGQALGTPSYMPPEQARGQLEAISPASDVYGLGAILYCLLTGRPPFQAADPVETMDQVCTQEPVPPRTLNPQVPRDLETVCLKCLEKEPGKRYASAVAVADELRRWQAGEPITARPVGRIERAVKWVRRRPVVAALSAAVVLALVAGTAVSTLFAMAASRDAVKARSAMADADRQRRRAEEYYRRVRDAMVQAVLKLESPAYRSVAQLRPLRGALAEEALRAYQLFIDDNSSDPSVRFESGGAFLHIGELHDLRRQPEQAAEAYRKAVALLEALANEFPQKAAYHRDLGQAHHLFGLALRRLGRTDEAREVLRQALSHYRAALELDDSDYRGVNYLAWVLATLEDRELRIPAEAVVLAEKAVALAPESGSCWNTLGVARYTAGNNREAIAALRESLRLSKPGLEVYNWLFLAMAHARLGNDREARDWYEKARSWAQANRADGDEIHRLLAEAKSQLPR
jgi:tetratricopeptide (TPR) repeat protein